MSKSKLDSKSRSYNPKKKGSMNFILNDVAQEQSGFLEKEDDNEQVTQHDILDSVDMFSAQKYFDLNLDRHGPYRMDYSRNGRHLLIGGAKGHIAAFDWQTKALHCEINVMERVQDVKWLHIETMYAVAQKQWTYIYDNQGIELHCLKVMDRATRLEFLPYHFLLASINCTGFLSYIDVSVGKKVAGFSTQHGRCDIMTKNKSNGIINLGHSSGVVTLWSPNVKEPLVKMLAHRSAVKSLAIDHTGNYMVTSGLDHLLNVWDMRTYKQLKSVKLDAGASSLSISAKGFIGAALRNEVVVLNNSLINERVKKEEEEIVTELGSENVYLKASMNNTGIQNIQFCPFEDVLGIGHANGLSSILVPGSGEANFDAMEANPYESKNQRKQWEVKALLEKIQPELISLDPYKLKLVDKKSLEEKMTERNKKLFLKPRKIDFQPRLKMKGKSKTGRKEARKKAVKEAILKDFVKEVRTFENEEKQQDEVNTSKKSDGKKEQKRDYNVFDRFKKKSN